MAPRSIRTKLISLYVVLLSVVFLCFGAYIYLGFRAYLVHSLDQTLNRRAQQIASTILVDLPTRGPGYVASEIQARYAPELNERVIRITSPSGEIIYASKNASELSPALKPLGTKAARRNEHAGAEWLRVVTLPYQLSIGQEYLVEVAAPGTPIEDALRGLMLMLGLGFLVLIGLAIAGGYSLLGRALHPVDEIVRSAEGITYKNLSERLSVPATGDEFERIATALNRMIARLDEAFRVAMRFSGDASHELRTPLTVIRGELEGLLKGSRLSDEVRETVGEVLGEAERLTSIVEGLLLVSRLESGESQRELEPLDLGALAGHIAEQLEPVAREKQLVLRPQLESGVLIEGNAVRIKQIVVNLLDNAIKYTPPGGTVTIRVSGSAPSAELEVADTGIGIGEEAQKHVFDRFFRAEEVRAGRIEGTGLGLAIVHSIVEASQGSISVTSARGQGSSFLVRFPRLHPT